MLSILISTTGLPRPESHSNKDMKKEVLKSAAEPQYEAPAVAVLKMQNEGVLCASTEEFEDEVLWEW